jgi:pimeloyl-ACP methyl ester carboxylesterase
MSLTARVEAWRARGRDEFFRARRIHVFRRESEDPYGDPPLLVLLHGFPTSSYDWRLFLEEETIYPVLAFDFLGFGLSEKPREHLYTLGWQADLTEELVRRHGDSRSIFVVAHDMGTSVATELMARDIEGNLGIDLAGILLFNGSIVLERASPTPAQKLLRGRAGPLAARLTTERLFRLQFSRIFSPDHPLSDEEAEDQWSLITANGGRTLGHRLVTYMDERVKFADRWHGAIRDWQGPLSFCWGMRDPVATPDVLAALRELRPKAPVEEFPDVGHYPQIEDPTSLAAAVRTAFRTAV